MRRLTAEEFRDALTTVTGIGYGTADTDAGANIMAKENTPTKLKGKWIWNNPMAEKAAFIFAR